MSKQTFMYVVLGLLCCASPLVVQHKVSATVELAAPEQRMMAEENIASLGGNLQINMKSEYVLPYPGILPNHPLYFLKEFRDRVIETLIVDPVRKSDFYLLQADKFLASVTPLINVSQADIAGRVVNQAADRMKMAVDQLSGLQKDGRQIPAGSIDKLNNAIEKHLETIDELSVEKKVSTDQARSSYLATQETLMKLK